MHAGTLIDGVLAIGRVADHLVAEVFEHETQGESHRVSIICNQNLHRSLSLALGMPSPANQGKTGISRQGEAENSPKLAIVNKKTRETVPFSGLAVERLRAGNERRIRRWREHCSHSIRIGGIS